MIKYYNEDHIGEVILSGGTEQRNLPEGYTQVEYLQSDGSCYIDLLRVPNNNDIIEQKFQIVSISSAIYAWYGSMPASNQITPRIGIGCYNGRFFCGINHTIDLGIINTNVHTLRFQATGQIEITYTFDGTTATGSTTTDTDTPVIQLSSYLFARHGDNGVQVYDGNGTKIFYHKEYLADNTLVMNLIPCRRNSDNVLGMYDTVSGQFLTNQGTGTFTAGDDVVPTPDAPMDIVCNNGVLKLSPNLFNKDLVPDENKYISKSNGNTAAPTNPTIVHYRHSDYITIKENTQYYVGIIISAATTAGLAFYDDTKTYISGISLTELDNNNNIITSPTNTKYIRFSFRIDDGYNTNWQNTVYFIEGNQPLAEFIPYNVIYADGEVETVTVTGKNLFNVSDYSSSSDWQGSGTYKYVEIPLPNGTYTVSWDKTKGASYIYWLIQVTESVVGTSNIGIGGSWLWHATVVGLQKEKFTFTVTEGKAWFSCAFNNFNKFLACLETVQIEHGSAATEYEPYFNGGTATAEMLLKVGDYVDTQKVIKGEVTRNVGVIVLTGTEKWVIAADSYIKSDACDAYFSINIMKNQNNYNCVLFCNIASVSHAPIWNRNGCANKITANVKQLHLNIANDVLGITDYTQETRTTALAKFKQFLANQYANGTPVIVVYPLATPTTEEVDSQFLDGEYVEQISGAISNLPIDISHIHDLKKRYVTDSNGNATEITKIYKGNVLLWEKV